MKSMIILYLNS